MTVWKSKRENAFEGRQPRNASLLLISYWIFTSVLLILSLFHQPVFQTASSKIQEEDPSMEIFHYHNFNTTFFIETGYNAYLTDRQACAVESAAIAHRPNNVTVYMLGLDKGEAEVKNSWTRLYDNIKLVKLYPHLLFKNSPLKKAFHSKKMRFGQHRMEHTVNYIRTLILQKYGGLYLDLDFIIMKPFLDLGRLIVRESHPLFVAGVSRFKAGDDLINEFFTQLTNQEYDPDSWAGTGTDLLTEVARKVCDLEPESEDLSKPNKCNITVKGKEFFPVSWEEWTKMFAEDTDIEKFRPEILTESIAVHFNDHHFKNTLVAKNGSTILNQLAKKYCPEAYKQFPDMF